MICSVVGSSALVASSSTRMDGSATSARAISRRCRWPPLKLPSALVDPAAVAPGPRRDVVVDRRVHAPPARRPRSGTGGVPQRDVLAYRALEQHHLLVDEGQ